MHDWIWSTSRKRKQRNKKGYYRTPDYHIGNRPHTAKFKIVRNVGLRLFTSYSIDSNLQDEIAGQDGVRIWRKKIFRKLSTIWIPSKLKRVKYLWGMVKQIQHGLFLEVVKIPGPSALDAWDYFPPLVSCIQHLGTSNFYYFPQYHVVFV